MMNDSNVKFKSNLNTENTTKNINQKKIIQNGSLDGIVTSEKRQ